MSGSQEEVITRRSGRDRPERQVHHEEPSVVIEHGGEQISAEDALADTQRLLTETTKATAEARRAQRDAESRARTAEASAHSSRATDRSNVVASLIAAATAEQVNARASYRMAREAGDLDAEIEAAENLANANMRLSQANAENEWIKHQPRQPAQTQDGPSTAAQRWLDDHPAYQSDRKYRGTAQAAHTEALQAGHQNGSQQYVDFIDRIMEEEYGAGHGQTDGGQRVTEQRRNTERPAPRGDAAPPSRHSGGNAGGWRTVDTGIGSIQYQDRSDGSRGIRFTRADQKEDFEEGARISRMSLADYANEHIAHALEVAAGGGDIKRGEGENFR